MWPPSAFAGRGLLAIGGVRRVRAGRDRGSRAARARGRRRHAIAHAVLAELPDRAARGAVGVRRDRRAARRRACSRPPARWSPRARTSVATTPSTSWSAGALAAGSTVPRTCSCCRARPATSWCRRRSCSACRSSRACRRRARSRSSSRSASASALVRVRPRRPRQRLFPRLARPSSLDAIPSEYTTVRTTMIRSQLAVRCRARAGACGKSTRPAASERQARSRAGDGQRHARPADSAAGGAARRRPRRAVPSMPVYSLVDNRLAAHLTRGGGLVLAGRLAPGSRSTRGSATS